MAIYVSLEEVQDGSEVFLTHPSSWVEAVKLFYYSMRYPDKVAFLLCLKKEHDTITQGTDVSALL